MGNRPVWAHSEAGLNDGLAFPLTNLPIAAAAVTTASREGQWLVDWFLVDVCYKIGVGIVVGYAVGWVMSRFIVRLPETPPLAETMAGMGALSTALLAFGFADLLAGTASSPCSSRRSPSGTTNGNTSTTSGFTISRRSASGS